MPPKPATVPATPPVFDVPAFLKSARISPRTVRFATGVVVFAAGDIASCGSNGDEQTAALVAQRLPRTRATVLTLGFWTPVTIEWTCAKPTGVAR